LRHSQLQPARRCGESKTIQDGGCNTARCTMCDRVRSSKPHLRTGYIELRERRRSAELHQQQPTARRHASAAQNERACQQLGQRNATSWKALSWHEEGGRWSDGLVAGFRCVKEEFSLPLRNVVVVEASARLVSRRLFAQRQGRLLHHSNSIFGHPNQAFTPRHRSSTRVLSNGPWLIGLPCVIHRDGMIVS
jgi:hypothetical protein